MVVHLQGTKGDCVECYTCCRWVLGARPKSVEIKNSVNFIRRWNLTRTRIVTQPSQAFKEKEDRLSTS